MKGAMPKPFQFWKRLHEIGRREDQTCMPTVAYNKKLDRLFALFRVALYRHER